MELLLAQFLHNFAPGMIGGIAYICYLITLWTTIKFMEIISYLVLSSLVGYVIFLFLSLFSWKILIFLWIPLTKDQELLKVAGGLWGFLWKQSIEWAIKWTPKYIDKIADKWLKK